MNVLMIVSDTVRQDYFGVNGGRVRTPNLDAFSRESVYFRRAYANSFPTLPARADYMTGTYSLTDIGWGPLPREMTTLPELLRSAGITTMGVVDTPFYVVDGYNYDRGFQYFRYLPTQIAWNTIDHRVRLNEYDYCAPKTITVAEKALEQLAEGPFFLLVDVWDPHEPWDPPAYYARKYKPDYDGRVIDPIYGDWAAYGYSEDDLLAAIACYCGELEMVDRWIGRLLERLDSLGLAEETAVIFVSDHGFYFGEYGVLGKMTWTNPRPVDFRARRVADFYVGDSEPPKIARSPLYPEVTNVPLMVRIPGVEPRFDDHVVSSAINMAPTVLDLFGVDKPEHMLGRSLLPLVRSAELPGDEFAITACPLANAGVSVRLVDDRGRFLRDWQPITVTSDQWTLLFSRWEDPIELYAIGKNGHRDGLGPNLAPDRPEIVKELHAKMVAELARAGASEQAIADRR